MILPHLIPAPTLTRRHRVKALATVASLGIISISGCMSAAPEGAHAETDADRSSWALGRYELVSFNGQSLPVELSKGRILSGGYLVMAAGRDGLGPVGFEMHFSDPTPAPWWSGYGVSRSVSVVGSVWAFQEPVKGAQNLLHFDAKTRMVDYEASMFRGFDEWPLGWADPYMASGTLFGNELRVGDGENLLVFMKRSENLAIAGLRPAATNPASRPCWRSTGMMWSTESGPL
jgi:hypothetical protein